MSDEIREKMVTESFMLAQCKQSFDYGMTRALEGDLLAPAARTMRDYFAAQALSGMLADPNVNPIDAEQRLMLCAKCYEFSDAMLEARRPKK